MREINFRIFKRTDGNGVKTFFVKRERHFLWIPFLPFWKKVKKTYGVGRDKNSITRIFTCEEDAVMHIENVIITNIRTAIFKTELIHVKSYNIKNNYGNN